MKTNVLKAVLTAIIAVTMVTVLCTGSAQAGIANPNDPNWPAPVWPEIFEPNQPLMNLNIEMLDPNDWNVIRLNGMLWDDGEQKYIEPDDPNVHSYELPAWFWADGEEDKKIKVAVRQKSNTPLGDANDRYFKIALKVDINQYYTEDANGDPNGDPNAAAHWRNLSKLSLETGDDVDVVAEGLACNLHTMSSGSEGYGYDAWRGNWVTLRVQNINRGVYINVEQRNKLFLENRNWVEDPNNTWLYKITGENETLLKVPDMDSGEVPPDYPDSPARIALNYTPFMPPNPAPDDAGLVADMDTYVNMQGMLAMAAINAFTSNHDSLFSHYQNTYFIDYNVNDPCETRKRMYLPWDVDSIMKSADADGDIYDREDGSTTWQEIFLDSPTYRPQYNQVMSDLMGTSLTQSNIHSFLDMMLPILHDALAADPYNQFASPGEAGVLERFSQIKTWYSGRIVNILDQTWWDEPAGIVLLKDGFEGTVWNDNWTGAWLQNTNDYKGSYTSAHAEDGSELDFTCGNLDAGDANVIHVTFWIMKDDTENDDIDLYYYNGATDSYDYITDLDTLGADDVWLYYTDVITNSNYFEPDFKIRFHATVGSKENVWVDDVVITKLIPEPNEPVISGYILGPKNTGIDGILMLANNGGGSVLTDANGFYELSVPYGWSGTITPTEPEYTFAPSERTYRPVVIDHPQRWDPDYDGTSIYDLNIDGYINFADFAEFALAWLSSTGESNWNLSCDFVVDGNINWYDLSKFTEAWLSQYQY